MVHDVYVGGTARERAERGAAWLDGVSPGWELRVDLDLLAMEKCSRCIIGQVLGSWEGFFEELPILQRDLGFIENCGFDVDDTFPSDTDYVSYAKLGEAWTALIKERLDAGIAL